MVKAGCTRGHVGALEGWRVCWRVGGRVRGLGWRVQRSAGCVGWLAGALEKGKAGW
jgi:hypothetical protein